MTRKILLAIICLAAIPSFILISAQTTDGYKLFIDFASGEYLTWYEPFLESVGGNTMISESYPGGKP